MCNATQAPTLRRPSLAELIPDWPTLHPFRREEVCFTSELFTYNTYNKNTIIYIFMYKIVLQSKAKACFLAIWIDAVFSFFFQIVQAQIDLVFNDSECIYMELNGMRYP